MVKSALMHRNLPLIYIVAAALLSLTAVSSAEQITRNPGSRSGLEREDSVFIGSQSSSPFAESTIASFLPSDSVIDLETVLLRSIAKVAAFDFKRAANSVLGEDSNAGYPGYSMFPAQSSSVDDLEDPFFERTIEQPAAGIYDKPVHPQFATDDTLTDPAEKPVVEYPNLPESNLLDRHLELLPQVPQTEPELPAEIKGSEPARISLGQMEQLERAAPAVAQLAGTGSSALAPASIDLPGMSFGMPPGSLSPFVRSVARGNPGSKQVALTFDDGPHPEFTSRLLAVLEHYDVKATFFFVGIQSQKHPQWVKMASQAGHEIASQTYDHFRMPRLPLEEKVYQIDEYQRLIEGLVGITPRFLRPPGGQLDPETERLLADRGMVLALWDVALNDTREGKTADEMLRIARKDIRPGSVILAHDGIMATVEMLPDLIEYLQGRGYEFVTMSELAAGL